VSTGDPRRCPSKIACRDGAVRQCMHTHRSTGADHHLHWAGGKKWLDGDDDVLATGTPARQCPDESAHPEHEWYEDNTFRRQCDGFVGRAGVPAGPRINSELTDRPVRDV
jgi:hypothetical protein